MQGQTRWQDAKKQSHPAHPLTFLLASCIPCSPIEIALCRVIRVIKQLHCRKIGVMYAIVRPAAGRPHAKKPHACLRLSRGPAPCIQPKRGSKDFCSSPGAPPTHVAGRPGLAAVAAAPAADQPLQPASDGVQQHCPTDPSQLPLLLGGVRVVLVSPKTPANIGAVLRVAENFEVSVWEGRVRRGGMCVLEETQGGWWASGLELEWLA